jgi:hypothetical protein
MAVRAGGHLLETAEFGLRISKIAPTLGVGTDRIKAEMSA